jgi:hypothetical protein
MTPNQELYAKALEIAALMIGKITIYNTKEIEDKTLFVVYEHLAKSIMDSIKAIE